MKTITVLKEMIGIILIYGGIVQLAGMWFVKDPGRFTSGLWIGIALAIFMVWHMYRSLNITLELDEKGAVSHARKCWAFRVLVVFASALIVWYFDFGNLVLVFIGIMGLKAAAYLQPLFHRLMIKKS